MNRIFRLSSLLGILLFLASPTLAAEPTEGGKESLLEIIEKSEESSKQKKAAQTLAKSKDPEAVSALVAGVTSYSEQSASICLAALAKHAHGSAIEAALQCIDAPETRCSKSMKSKAIKTAKSTWKKNLRGKGRFPIESLNIQLDIKVSNSIDKKDRWERHFHAELFEALMADSQVTMGEEVDLFSEGKAEGEWKAVSGIPLKISVTIDSIKRKAKGGGNFQYTVGIRKAEVGCTGFKSKTQSFKKISGVGISEDENSLETRIIKLALTDAALNFAREFQIWTRGKKLLEDPGY